MQYGKYGEIYAVRIDLGEDIGESLKRFCSRENIRLAQITGLGASRHAVIGVYDPARKEYCREELDEFAEIITLTGNVTWVEDHPFVHLHTLLADQRRGLHAGHVIALEVGATCELFVTPLPGQIGRERFEELGISVMRF